ncbi:MAG: hypothetical protein IH606_14750 [Burkholderiales bacterium]|nr:hypothetical protein [Burkholderiales bacterium]
MKTMKAMNQPGRKSLKRSVKAMAWLFRAVVLMAMTLATAHGQALDAVDVKQREADVEIILRFSTQIQYVRHNPLEQGQSLRIYVRLVGVGLKPGDLAPSTRRTPPHGPAPAAVIRFPEHDGAVSIAFDQSTRFSVRPGSDGRSISILIPARPDG